MSHYDLAVIGAGPGGYVAAIRASQLGLKTVCVDKRDEPGGTCLNVGCIPSKSLLQSTELYEHIKKEAATHGITCNDVSVNIKQMNERKNQVVKGLTDGIRGLFKLHKVDFIQGFAAFIDPHTLEISPNQKITANHFILATGSEPTPLPILPFDEKQIVSSTGALNLKKIPKKLLVIGGGIIGVELASVYNRLGSDVTIIEMLDHICPTMDRSLSHTLLQSLKKQGIKFLLSTQVVTAITQPNEIILTVNQNDSLSNQNGDLVLVSIGRRPYTQNLNLNKIGLQPNHKGFIPVDKNLKTSLPHIFAIGDLIEGPMLAHKASEEGVAAAESIANFNPTPIQYLAIPNVIYTFPEVASVGLTEQETKDLNLSTITATAYFKANARARCNGETEGFVKVIADSKSKRLIGMHIIGPHASELISEGMLAIQKKSTLHDLAYAPNAHPTLSETIKEASMIALGGSAS